MRRNGERENGRAEEGESRSIESSSTTPHSPRATIAGIEIDNLSEDEALDRIEQLILGGGSHYMAVVNAAKVVSASRDARLRRMLMKGDLVTADGMSVVWAARLLGRRLKGRVTGIDVFERLIERAAERGWAIYFLGAREHSVETLVERLRARHPRLRVAGYRNGYFEDDESDSIAEAIKRSGADLLFVGMGSPAQEKWIEENLEKTGVKFALGVGGSFDHVSGLVPRAPRWMQRAGLEWLHRLAREPRRLWRRYLVGNTLFILLVAKQMIKGKSDAGAMQTD
jgi:N-acetylglucosaminyldiphosphoundecaprenol N-acetyl-beta-D-mannosaminyltransferase